MSPTEAVDAFPAVKEKKSKKKKAAAAATTTAEPSEHPEPPQDLAHDDPEADAAAAEAPKTQKKAKRAAVDGDRSADGDSDAARRAAKAAKKKAREEAVARNLPAIAAAVSALDAAAAANMAVVTAALAEGGALDRLSLATAVSATKDKNRSRKTADSEASAQPDAPKLSVGDLPAAQNTTNGEAAVPRKQKSKKQDGAAPSVDINTAVEGEPSDTSERKKKKKKKKREPEDAQPAGRAEPSKKRKKDKYPDPAEDTELSDHAQKAISNAHAFVVDPTTWKFNKAAQNWLLRNIWSDAAIPERYSKTVIKFLRTVQGGARQSLIAKCKSYTTEIPIVTGDGEASQESAPSTQTQRTRAEALLVALESPSVS